MLGVSRTAHGMSAHGTYFLKSGRTRRVTAPDCVALQNETAVQSQAAGLLAEAVAVRSRVEAVRAGRQEAGV